MALFNFICKPSIAEEIILGNSKCPELNILLTKEVKLCLKTTSDQFDKIIENDENPIFLRFKNNPIENFKPILIENQDSSDYLKEQHLKSAIFDNDGETDVDRAIPKFRIEEKTLDYYKGSYTIDFIKNNFPNKSWNDIFTTKENEKNKKFWIPKSNALVINDSYLFQNNKKINNNIVYFGVVNLLNLLTAILPEEVNSEYHLTIFTSNANLDDFTSRRIFNDLYDQISKLRNYPIHFELIIWDITFIHKRFLISNYYNVTIDKGFSVFDENGKVREDNDLLIRRLFHDIDQPGITPYEQNLNFLNKLSRIYDDSKLFSSKSQNSKGKIFLSSNIDIRNRLLL